MKYYYKLSENIILYIGKGKKVPKNCVEITREQYELYDDIIKGIEQKDGYITVTTLYADGSYTVDYILAEDE